MEDWLWLAVIVSYVLTFVLIRRTEQLHRIETDYLHEVYRLEREELLDRIMSNNVHEFKAATHQADVKKSTSGNFLVDRMKHSVAKQYTDIE